VAFVLVDATTALAAGVSSSISEGVVGWSNLAGRCRHAYQRGTTPVR
jgi:hypothetical protein